MIRQKYFLALLSFHFRFVSSAMNKPLSLANTLPADSFEQRQISKLFHRMPAVMKTLANLCQSIDDHPLTEAHTNEIEQRTIDSILWDDTRSHPIAIDQNPSLNELRQLVRDCIHEVLEFAHQILVINDRISPTIQQCRQYLQALNTYRTARQDAFDYFSHHASSADANFALVDVDQEQFYQLRIIALHLRQALLRSVALITPEFASLA